MHWAYLVMRIYRYRFGLYQSLCMHIKAGTSLSYFKLCNVYMKPACFQSPIWCSEIYDKLNLGKATRFFQGVW